MTAAENTVLVVEDDESYVEALTIGLQRDGFTVCVARDGTEAIDVFDSAGPAIVLLDLMLPRVSGIDVCRQLRARSSVPIIMVTAKSSEVDTVVGLEVGADDYVTKPYRMHELIARMRAVLRRSGPSATAASEDPETSYKVGDVELNSSRHEVIIRGEHVSLPLKEFEVLKLLLANAGRVLTREKLISIIWGPGHVGDPKTLDVHVKRLRSKVEVVPARPSRIVTIRGVGYKYEVAR
jgi:two-component system response regulator RegX3